MVPACSLDDAGVDNVPTAASRPQQTLLAALLAAVYAPRHPKRRSHPRPSVVPEGIPIRDAPISQDFHVDGVRSLYLHIIGPPFA